MSMTPAVDTLGAHVPHVFVTRGDLTHVHCDAWMVPTDRTLSVRAHWRTDNPELESAIREFDDPEFTGGRVHTSAPRWPHRMPLPIFTAVPYSGFRRATDFVEIIDSFVQTATRSLTGAHLTNRPLPLLAMPIIGARGGGGASVVGDLIRMVLKSAEASAAHHRTDIVVVVRTAAELGLAQRIRREAGDRAWTELDPSIRAEAKSLSSACIAGTVVPFLGAGISMSAGSPNWAGLVRALTEAVDRQFSDQEKRDLAGKSTLDQAEILKDLYESEDSFNSAVVKLVDVKSYGLAPTLIANLPLDQAITLNYDRLFEIASNDAQQPCAVIPPRAESDDSEASRWLLKLHGNADDPSSIVLTRTDYLGFDANRNVLAALVKASLVTKRLVFIGFGLGDDHFHQILHDVRAVSPKAIAQNALALTLSENALESKIWKDKIALLPMTPAGTSPIDAGRILEIFLDLLLMHSTDSREYLLDPAFASQLTEPEERLKELVSSIHQLDAETSGSDPSTRSAIAALRGFGQSPD